MERPAASPSECTPAARGVGAGGQYMHVWSAPTHTGVATMVPWLGLYGSGGFGAWLTHAVCTQHTTTRAASVRCTSCCGSAPPPPPALVAHRLSPLSLSAHMPCQSAPLPPSPPTDPPAAPRMPLVRLHARPGVIDYCLLLAPAASAHARVTWAALTTTATNTTTFSTMHHPHRHHPTTTLGGLSE
jgi:hypothetical protein